MSFGFERSNLIQFELSGRLPVLSGGAGLCL